MFDNSSNWDKDLKWRLCEDGTIFYSHNLTLTLTVPLPSMNLALNCYHTISCKISFVENLHNLALIQPGKSHSDGVVQEHIAATLIGPPYISSDYSVKEVEEEMDFADALYDPSIILNMQSANGEVNQSLGLARNVAMQIGNITLYIQIHIICSPAYDILLGR